ncbi:HNH endonuclease signature motif containing protein [Williamsia sp.]|uniref:HNH endonuclease signature motif containing protein n=1 Tax=Williamsia sp. TaxID=1872085 RepID=UPI0025D84153|nr:HNH endonuclease signature motif containing protein [Williamsia sp.]
MGAGLLDLDAAIADDVTRPADEVIELIAHCAATVAAAQYRMMHLINRLHDLRTDDWVEDMAERFADDPATQLTPNGTEQTIAEVGAVTNVPVGTARATVQTALRMHSRMPLTGQVLGTGRISVSDLRLILDRTAGLFDDAQCDQLDRRLAAELSARPPMSRARLRALVDFLISQIDPEALRRRRERAEQDRSMDITPDRFNPGMSRVSGSLAAADAAVVNARLTDMARSVCSADPRTMSQRRADAQVVLAATGLGPDATLPCRCPRCVELVEEPEAAATPAAREAPASPVNVHVVVNLSTLVGLDQQPGYLDGHGVLDADAIRRLLAAAKISMLNPADPTVGEHRYRPGSSLDTLCRARSLCCDFPGCTTPAWRGDLDHTNRFDRRHPRAGGATVGENLKPLCRFHHRLKTFTRWRDFQGELGEIVFESPTGHCFLGNAFNGADLFPSLRPPPRTARPPTAADERRTRRILAEREAYRAWTDQPPPF